MRSVSIRQLDMKQATIPLGFEGENEFTEVRIDCKKTFDQHPNAVPSMIVTDPAGNKYPAVVTRDGDIVVWNITAGDLTTKGSGEIQIEFLIDGTVIGRTDVARTRIERSIFPEGEAPEPVQNWIDEANQTLADVEEAKQAFPAGGTTGQVLTKKSDEDYDTEWKTPQGGGGGTSNYNDLDNKPSINGVTLSGNKSLSDLSIPSQEDVNAKYTKPQGGIPASDIDPSAIPSPTSIIDDNAGEGDTNKVLSADKVTEITTGLSEAITNDLPETKPSSSQGVDLDVCDESGNVILRLKDGDIQTKNFNSHDPYIVPDYYHANGYLAGKCNRLNQLARACAGKMDTFAFCTDQHWTLNAGKSPALLRYIKENTNIDKFFFGGDFCDFVTSEHQPFDGFRQYNEALDVPLYTTMGNHDYMSQYGTEGRLYYTFNSAGRDRFGNFDRNYFYIDNPQAQIRYIFLNGYQPGTNTWAWGYEADQLAWLTNTALNLEAGWGAIIVTHVVYNGISNDNTPILDSHCTGMLSVLDNYSGDGEVIAVVCGHAHTDWTGETTGGIPIIVSTCDKYGPWISGGVDQEPWLSDRVAGTITEQAIDLFVVDREAKTLTRVRVGIPIHEGYDPTTWTEVEEETVSYDRT